LKTTRPFGAPPDGITTRPENTAFRPFASTERYVTLYKFKDPRRRSGAEAPKTSSIRRLIWVSEMVATRCEATKPLPWAAAEAANPRIRTKPIIIPRTAEVRIDILVNRPQLINYLG